MAQPAGQRFLKGIAALAIGLALSELAARVLLSVPAVSSRLTGDESGVWRRRWVAIQRGRRAAHPMIATDRYDEFLGWRPLPNLDLVIKGARLTTNAQGFRAAVDLERSSSPGVRRVLVLGDSFTFGEDVADDEAWPAVLDRRLPNADVLNLGVHGYGHDQMLLRLRREGLNLRPDVVLLGFVGVDLTRNRLDFRDAAKPRFILRHGSLILESDRVPTRDEVLVREFSRLALADLVSLAAFRWRRATGTERQHVEALGRALLETIASEAATAGARPVFLYLPASADLANLGEESPDERFFSAACRSIGEREPRLTCGSATAAFATAVARGERLEPGRHWGPAGHRAAAEAAAQLLVE